MYVAVVDGKGMCGCWRSLLSAYVANAALEADLGGIEGGRGGGPPPLERRTKT